VLAAWFGPPESGHAGQDLFAVPLEGAGPIGPTRALFHAPANPDLLVVRRSAGERGGFTLLWSALLDRGEVLTTLGAARDGTSKGDPIEIHRTNDHVAWLDVLPVASGALGVWAEETPSGTANILVDPLDAAGRPRAVPMRIAHDARRWQAVSTRDVAGIALVTGDSIGPGDVHGTGALTWQLLDADGRPKGSAIVVAKDASVDSNVEVVPFADGWLLAWTDFAHEDPQVMLATIDSAGRIGGPSLAFEAGSASVLSALSTSAGRTAIAWTEPHRRQGDTQVLGVGLVSPDGRSIEKPVAAFEVGVTSPPELVATDTGFAVLAPARACWAESPGHSCGGPLTPTFIRFDQALEPAQAEPLLVGDPKSPATLGWALSCGPADRCFALAASSETPTPVFSVDLPARSSPFAVPMVPPPPPDAPHLANVKTVSSGMSLDDLAAARLGQKTLVATLTSESEDKRSRRTHPGAVISTFMIDGNGVPSPEPLRLSTRADSIGGVSMAPGGSASDGALVTWISGRKSNGEVRLAQVSEAGRLERSLRLASADGDASRVVAAWAGDGWIVAWVDDKNGRDQVYATKIGRHLQRSARDERITSAAVGPADLALAVGRDTAWLAWSDARESPRDGVADIYATTLHLADATRAGEETRVLATASHSRSPALASLADTALIAWIEDAPTGIDAPAEVMIGCLDRRATVLCPPVELRPAAAGQATAIDLQSAGDEVHAVVARSGIGGITLDGIRLGAGASPLGPSWPLVVLDAPAAVDVSVAIAGDQIIYSDVVPGPGQRRVRLAEIGWRR
jgi:hypothetical protein